MAGKRRFNDFQPEIMLPALDAKILQRELRLWQMSGCVFVFIGRSEVTQPMGGRLPEHRLPASVDGEERIALG